MHRKIIQIKGTHGSGKTTIIRQLISLSGTVELLYNDKGKEYAALLHDLKFIVLGKNGSCDNLDHDTRRIETMKSVLCDLSDMLPDYWLVFEGALIGNSMTMYNHLMQYDHDAVLIVMMVSTLDNCVRRIEQRRGSKLDSLLRTTEKFESISRQRHNVDHIVYMHVDDISIEDMVYEFLAVINWEMPNGK